MTIQECYKEMGADYEEVFHRLPPQFSARHVRRCKEIGHA